ncbi:MAG: NAD(P)-dependent oxidoreductase [Sinobacterium sp.]|nr:NAD(P)-dependent oxidoreductase [Sinobacterium sp.]
MKVLVTGSFGNIGSYTVNMLLKQNHDVTCFDLKTPKSVKASAAFPKNMTIKWGDMCNKSDVVSAINNVDVVIHLAAIIPPQSEMNTKLAYSVNVEGTNNLIQAMEESNHCKRIIFASTTAVHGSNIKRKPPVLINEAFNPPDDYAKHKITCEQYLAKSSLNWTILRVAAAPPLNIKTAQKGGIELVFGIPVNGRIEALHAEDAGLAFANAISCDAAIGKTMFIAGGKSCQASGYEFVNTMMRGAGIGDLPQSAFSTDPSGAHADWVDTSDSEALLNYQKHSLLDIENELKKNSGLLYFVIRALAPLVRHILLRKSPHYKT